MDTVSAQGIECLRHPRILEYEHETAVAAFWEPTEGIPYFVTPEHSLPREVWVP